MIQSLLCGTAHLKVMTRGVASQKLMGGRHSPMKLSKSFMIANKANDPMMGSPTYSVVLLQLT